MPPRAGGRDASPSHARGSREGWCDVSVTCRNTTGIADPDLCSKRCTDHPFTGPCDVCGELVEGVTYGGLEVIGAVHSGCFGYPLCSCAEPHQGECPEETRP